MQKAAQHILNRLPQRPQAEKLYGSLFLQLNVDRLGLSIPLSENASPVSWNLSRHHTVNILMHVSNDKQSNSMDYF